MASWRLKWAQERFIVDRRVLLSHYSLSFYGMTPYHPCRFYTFQYSLGD